MTIDQLVDIAEEIGGIKLKRTYNLNAPKGVDGRDLSSFKAKGFLVQGAGPEFWRHQFG